MCSGFAAAVEADRVFSRQCSCSTRSTAELSPLVREEHVTVLFLTKYEQANKVSWFNDITPGGI